MGVVSATKLVDTSWLPGWTRQRRLDERWPGEVVVWLGPRHRVFDDWGERCCYPAPRAVTDVLGLPPMRYAFHGGA